MKAHEQLSLIERIRRGEEAAFTELVDRYQDTVRRLTAMWAPSGDEADDIAQEVFLAAFRGIDRFDPSRDLKAWLLGIARNLTRQAWRRVARSPRSAGGEALESILERHALEVFRERHGHADKRRAALAHCIDRLPRRTKETFSRYVIEETSSSKLASFLGTTEGTVRATISRVRRLLHACIERFMALEGSP